LKFARLLINGQQKRLLSGLNKAWTVTLNKNERGKTMKVQNMTGRNGYSKVANQFIIFDSEFTAFQSYNSIIVKTVFEDGERKVYLDADKWDYSTTTGKYRNQFLGETKKETEAKIKSGEYTLIDLNN
jgi:hypothetical protein